MAILTPAQRLLDREDRLRNNLNELRADDTAVDAISDGLVAQHDRLIERLHTAQFDRKAEENRHLAAGHQMPEDSTNHYDAMDTDIQKGIANSQVGLSEVATMRRGTRGNTDAAVSQIAIIAAAVGDDGAVDYVDKKLKGNDFVAIIEESRDRRSASEETLAAVSAAAWPRDRAEASLIEQVDGWRKAGGRLRASFVPSQGALPWQGPRLSVPHDGGQCGCPRRDHPLPRGGTDGAYPGRPGCLLRHARPARVERRREEAAHGAASCRDSGRRVHRGRRHPRGALVGSTSTSGRTPIRALCCRLVPAIRCRGAIDPDCAAKGYPPLRRVTPDRGSEPTPVGHLMQRAAIGTALRAAEFLGPPQQRIARPELPRWSPAGHLTERKHND